MNVAVIGAGPTGLSLSYRPYVWTVVRSAALDYLTDKVRDTTRELSDEEFRSLASQPAGDDLEHVVRQFAEYEGP